MITLWCIFTVEQNHFFYSNIGRDSSGSFPRLSLTYNTGFYLFAVYLAIYCMAGILLCLHTARHCTGIERKRLYCCICGIICPWIPILLRSLGLTGGYEMRLEPLMESGYLQGYMLWAINMTEHYKHLMKIEDIADFKESLSHTKYTDVTAVSIGIAICRPVENEPAISYAKLYSRADRALYISKNNGKNTWYFYS